MGQVNLILSAAPRISANHISAYDLKGQNIGQRSYTISATSPHLILPRAPTLLQILACIPTFRERSAITSRQQDILAIKSSQCDIAIHQYKRLSIIMASRVMVPFLVAMMLLTGVCNTLLSKYQVCIIFGPNSDAPSY